VGNCKPTSDFSYEVAASTFPLYAIHISNETLQFLQIAKQIKD